MSQFPPAYDYVMKFEDPLHLYKQVRDNNGGEVISGINSKAWPSDFALVASIFQPQRGPYVATFYQKRFWEHMQLGGLESQDVANRLIDMAVNAGDRPAVKLLQQAINSLRFQVAVDGVIGPATLEAANQCDPEALLAAFREQRKQHYEKVAEDNPDDAGYLPVWLARAEA